MTDGGKTFVGFKRHLRVAVVEGEAAYLVSPTGVTALRGRHIAVLAPLLDGSRTLATLVRDAAPALSVTEVGAVISRLADANLLTCRDALPAEPAAAGSAAAAEAFWDLAGLDGFRATHALAAAQVEVVAIGPVDAPAVLDACRASGVSAVLRTDPDEPGPAALTIVLCDDYLAPELARVDAAHTARRRPWLLARPSGPEPWIGPLFRPGDGPCWSCLAHRLGAHRRAALGVDSALGGAGVRHPEASIAAARTVAVQFAVLEAAKWLAGMRQEDQDTVYTLDTLTLRGRRHRVVRRPQCPACGDPDLVAAAVCRPIVPVSRLKSFTDGSGHRALSPEETLERYQDLVSPITGIIGDLQRDERAPRFLHNYLSGPNLALPAQSLDALRANLRGQSGGKGTTAVEAKVGALCEAVERYCATRQGDEPVVRASYRELGDEAVHPDACQLFHPRQFRDRDRWNATALAAHRVCAPFDERAVREWTPVWSLTAGRHRLLPTSLLYFHRGRHESTPEIDADSNGNAAGSSLEDAIVQGFLEVVERDAIAIWWYNRTRQPQLDLDAFAEPWIERTRHEYRRMSRHVWALDLTTDLGIPVIVALSRRSWGRSPEVVFGFGAHFDPRIALRRALTEMGQLFGSIIGPGCSVAPPRYLSDWWDTMPTFPDPYLMPGDAPVRTPDSYQYTPHADLRDDVADITRLVGGHGMELLVLDQTRPDIGLPVVKVLVPGLRSHRTRLAPGRLYDVPVALGLRDAPVPYRSLNPVPLFI